MKTPSISVTALFFALALFLIQGCSEIQGSSIPADSETKSEANFEIPQLLPRTQGLGSIDERVQVNENYDKQVALLKQDSQNSEARLAMAALFMQEARVTGEHPYYYPEALELLSPLTKRLDLNDEHRFQAHYLTASVLLSQHEFAAALVAGEKARAIFPQTAAIYGVLIDAHVELGEYDEAVRLSDQMVSMRPDLRSYSRISYLRELHGDPKGAIEAMELAVSAGMPGYEQTAWCRVTLGELQETYGDLKAAEMQYLLVLQERPDYPFALAGLASVAQRQGDLEKSMEYLDKAIALIPEVGFYEQKSSLLAEMGDVAAAEALVPEIIGMIEEDLAGGHIMDLELASVQLELAKDYDAALAAARKAEQMRPENLEVQAMLARIHAAKGEMNQSTEYASKARRTGWMNPDLLALGQ